MQAVYLDKMSMDRNDLDFSGFQFPGIEWQWYDATSSEKLDERISECEIVVCNKVVFDEAVFKRHPQLKLICVSATGTNNIDLRAASRAGVMVTNVTAYGTTSVSQHVMMLMLMMIRNFKRYELSVQEGDWHSSSQFCFMEHPIEELGGKTLGIIGYGELGKAVSKLAQAFGMNVIVAQRRSNDDTPGRVSLDELFTNSDIITLHCPLTEETRNLVDKHALNKMKPSALLINTARGGIVNEADLLEALKKGSIAGAALDVLEVEPPENSPLFSENLPNLIITPHIAWASRQARQCLLDKVAATIKSFVSGEKINTVN